MSAKSNFSSEIGLELRFPSLCPLPSQKLAVFYPDNLRIYSRFSKEENEKRRLERNRRRGPENSKDKIADWIKKKTWQAGIVEIKHLPAIPI